MKAQTGKYRQLLDYLDFRTSPVPWRKIIGTHLVEATPIDANSGYWDPTTETMKYNYGKSSTTKYYFPKKTLARLLKKGIDEGLVQKIKEPKQQGKKGRPCFLYGLAPGVSLVTPAEHFKVISQIDPIDSIFLGFETKGKNGKTLVKLQPQDKQIRDKLCLENPRFAVAYAEAFIKKRNKIKHPPRKPFIAR